MEYTQTFNANTFQFWGGARAIVDEIKRANKIDGLQEIIETLFTEQTPSATSINDVVWFESDFILKQLGLRPSPNDDEEEDE